MMKEAARNATHQKGQTTMAEKAFEIPNFIPDWRKEVNIDMSNASYSQLLKLGTSAGGAEPEADMTTYESYEKSIDANVQVLRADYGME